MIRLTNSLVISLLVMVVLLVAAGSFSVEKSREGTSGITISNMDTLVKPGDNFAAYVNGNGLKNMQIPPDRFAYGSYHLLIDKAQEDVKAIIEEAALGKFPMGADEQKIGDFYQSYMDIKLRDSLGLKPITSELKQIQAIATYTELAAYFAYANKRGNLAPINLWIIPDLKNPSRYMLYTRQAGLGMVEREYYLLEDAKSKDIRSKYLIHIEQMLTLAGIKQGKEKAKKIMELETLLASKHMKKEQLNNIEALYNKFAIRDFNTLMPDFAWNAFLKEAEVDKQDSVVIRQVDYTKALNEIIKNTPLNTWKSYLEWSLIHGAATMLTTALDKEDFEFYHKTLFGVQQQRPLWRRGVDIVNTHLGEMVGKAYVKKHFPPQAKARMVTLVNNLLKAYESSIKELDWMSEETKKQALDKLSKITTKIGYPNTWRNYSTLQVSKGDLYGNVQKATLFEYKRNINKLGKPVDRDEWIMTPQTVNAYYKAPLNEIVFPAAFLQPPFFDMNVDEAVNYGGIGVFIGHEIAHGFDVIGSSFDGNGVMRNWWSEKDGKEFKKRTAALVAQYNEFKVLDDLHLNGEFTLPENIADLAGMSIALKAYQVSLHGRVAPILDGFTGIQRVFMGWAQVWMIKDREEALRKQVQTSPHSPAQFRVNGVVRNMPEFYTAFNVKPTDSLYLAPEKRVKIW